MITKEAAAASTKEQATEETTAASTKEQAAKETAAAASTMQGAEETTAASAKEQAAEEVAAIDQQGAERKQEHKRKRRINQRRELGRIKYSIFSLVCTLVSLQE